MVATINSGKSLTTLQTGSAGFVSRYTDTAVAKKLLAMGVLPGSRIELVRKAPFGGGWYIKADNLLIALRQKEAESILLK